MILKRYKNFLIKESKVATNDSPIGFYTIANALSPDEYFKLLEENGIDYKHDTYRNFIEVFVNDEQQAKYAREKALDMDILEADDIEEDDLPYMTPDEIGDVMEIKMKESA